MKGIIKTIYKPITVGELRNAIQGLKADVPVYLADENSGTYGVTTQAGCILLLNQQEGKQDMNTIEGDYLVIRP